MLAKKDVILVFSGERENVPRLPMSILVLGAYIRGHGFKPILLDLRMEFDTSNIDWSSVLCVGISAMSGPSLLSGINFAKTVRLKDSGIPIVWGGPHASFFPEQTARSEYVDYVVCNEGEKHFLDLLRCFQKNLNVSNVKGITYVEAGKVISTSEEDFEDPNNFPLPAYDLIDMEKYLKGKGGNISYETSRGCPYRCTFCYAHFFHKNKWRPKSIGKVVSDLKNIVNQYNPEAIQFVEDNMFVNKQRVLELAQAMIDAGFKFKWNTTCRADSLSGFEIDELKLLKESGCTYLTIGVESGSEKILKKIQKDITKDHVRKAIKNCLSVSIMPMISLIIGLPGETKKDIAATLDFYDEMMSFDPKNIEINTISVYSPYPGTPIFNEACSLGYTPFTKLEDWAIWQVNDSKYVPWYSASYRRELDLISSISRFKYFVHRLEFYPREYKAAKLGSAMNRMLYSAMVPIFSADASFRWKHRIFGFAPEWRLFDFARVKFIKAK